MIKGNSMTNPPLHIDTINPCTKWAKERPMEMKQRIFWAKSFGIKVGCFHPSVAYFCQCVCSACFSLSNGLSVIMVSAFKSKSKLCLHNLIHQKNPPHILSIQRTLQCPTVAKNGRAHSTYDGTRSLNYLKAWKLDRNARKIVKIHTCLFRPISFTCYKFQVHQGCPSSVIHLHRWFRSGIVKYIIDPFKKVSSWVILPGFDLKVTLFK